jgi:translation elongation factor EF-1beta
MEKPRQVSPADVEAAVNELKQRLRETGGSSGLERIDCSPENIEQGLARLVLTLIELLRQLLERQAIRRMEGGSLSDQEVETMGEALMKLEAKIQELATHFGLTMADLNLDLGPLGHLLEK